MASNIIQLSFNGETSVVSEELVYKYDYGQQIEFTDLTLPEYFEVHFSNNKTGKATKQIGHNGVVDIPDRYLEIGSVYGWIFLHNTDSDGETEYEFKIPVKNRAMPSDGEVTPEQESAISQAIAALTSTQASVQALHDETEGYRDDASASSTSASASQDAAETAQGLAETAQGLAEDAQTAAEDAQSAAETAQGLAEDAQTAAESAQAAAEAARDEILDMGIVQDVVINGTSIVSDSVAKIPKANLNDWGVVKTATATLLAENYSYTKLTHMSGASEVVRNLAPMSLASFTQRGLMSKDDKVKLAHIASGAEVNVQSDWDQTDASADDYIKNKPTFADVAMSGSYNDLEDTPSIPTKVSDLENDVPYVEESSLKSALPTDTASGDIASFPDGTDLFPALSVKAQIEPIQSGSGTPSPSNVRPISGHTEVKTVVCGKNLFDVSKYLNVYTNFEYVDSGYACKIISLKPNTAYAVSHNSGVAKSNPILLINNEAHVNGNNYLDCRTASGQKVLTTDDTGNLYIGAAQSTTDTAVRERLQELKLQIEVGSVVTEYAPYIVPTTYTTALGRTVYGGTLDVVSGELVVDRVIADLSTLGFTYNNGWNCWTVGSIAGSKAPIDNNTPIGAISDRLTAVKASGYTSSHQSGTVARNTGGIWFVDNGSTTELTGQLCYELATPQTYQLDPTEVDLLLGQNNLWTDCGAVEVTYKADIQGYIDKKLAELQALVLEQ